MGQGVGKWRRGGWTEGKRDERLRGQGSGALATGDGVGQRI